MLNTIKNPLFIALIHFSFKNTLCFAESLNSINKAEIEHDFSHIVPAERGA